MLCRKGDADIDPRSNSDDKASVRSIIGRIPASGVACPGYGQTSSARHVPSQLQSVGPSQYVGSGPIDSNWNQ